MHPGLRPGNIKLNLHMIASAIVHRQAIGRWYGTEDNPLRARAVARYPLIEGAMYWPYINHEWTVEKRLQVIDQHYRMLNGAAKILADATFGDIELLRMDSEFPGLRLVLEKAPWFLREGEIVLSIFVNEHRVYSAAFTLGVEGGRTVAYVGALQGRSIDNVMEIYRSMTHAMHGMRPRDFLLSALKMLVSAVGVEFIWGVCTENQQHRGKYFAGAHDEKLVADYNEVWVEHGGALLGNGFFELQPRLVFKDIADIPTRKRATYRRRYAMLEKLSSDVNVLCIAN
jgi:uncharacterized protein VirK/YbjX